MKVKRTEMKMKYFRRLVEGLRKEREQERKIMELAEEVYKTINVKKFFQKAR